MGKGAASGGRWLLVLVAAGVVIGALGALLWGAGPFTRQAAEPERLTRVGDVVSFLWSHTEPRLLLVRRRGEDAAGRWVAGIGTPTLEPWEGTTPAERAALAGEFGFVHPDRCTPHVTGDAARVATVYPEGLSVVEAASGKATPVLRAGSAPSTFVDARYVYAPAWAPDGRRLAFTALESRSRLPRPVRERLRALPAPNVVGDHLEQWSQAGVRTAVWVLDTRTGFAWRVVDAGAFDPREGLTRTRLWLQWAPDGRRLGFIREGDVWAVPVEGP